MDVSPPNNYFDLTRPAHEVVAALAVQFAADYPKRKLKSLSINHNTAILTLEDVLPVDANGTEQAA